MITNHYLCMNLYILFMYIILLLFLLNEKKVEDKKVNPEYIIIYHQNIDSFILLVQQKHSHMHPTIEEEIQWGQMN